MEDALLMNFTLVLLWQKQMLGIVMLVFYNPDVKQHISKNKNVLSVYSRQFLLSLPLTQ